MSWFKRRPKQQAYDEQASLAVALVEAERQKSLEPLVPFMASATPAIRDTATSAFLAQSVAYLKRGEGYRVGNTGEQPFHLCVEAGWLPDDPVDQAFVLVYTEQYRRAAALGAHAHDAFERAVMGQMKPVGTKDFWALVAETRSTGVARAVFRRLADTTHSVPFSEEQCLINMDGIGFDAALPHIALQRTAVPAMHVLGGVLQKFPERLSVDQLLQITKLPPQIDIPDAYKADMYNSSAPMKELAEKELKRRNVSSR